MANRIKGITVEIGRDTTGLDKALKGVNTNIRNTQSEFKDVNRLLKLDPTNAELLAQKQKILQSAGVKLFVVLLNQQEHVLTTFDEKLFNTLVEKMVIHTRDKVAVHFKNGQVIEI